VTKPFVYYQFRDKREILAAISGYGAELSLSAIERGAARGINDGENAVGFAAA